MDYAERMSRLGTETAFEVLAAAKALEAEGRPIIHLEIGEPDFDTPANIVEAGIKALRDGWHHYTPAVGIKELREVISEEISRTRGIEVNPNEVVVTPGAKPIIFFSLQALAGPGDEVIYPNPGFPIYESVINFVGAKAVPIALKEELDFRMDVSDLIGAISPRTRMIILNSPNNPTGSTLTNEDLAPLAAACRDRDLVILSDEVYNRMIYEGEHASIASIPGMKQKTIILDGFSKTYAMTGWRLGYGVMESCLDDVDVDLKIILSDENRHIKEEFLAIASVVPAQIIGMFKSINLGLKPDEPSVSGTITRVVKGVQIYPYEYSFD